MAQHSGRLAGKSAIITGAARGIGREIARRFASEGCTVFLSDIDSEGLEAAARELGCRSQPADAGRRADIERMMDLALGQLGKLDILVNNVGMTHAATIQELSEVDFDRVLAVNLKSAFLASQIAAPSMIAQGGGAIVNMSSVNAILTIPTQIPYAVSKGGLNQLTKVLAVALAPHNIRVNAIGPGTIMTDLARTIMVDEAARQRILSRTPLGRCGEPEEVAAIASFLASDDASYVTGQTIYADGGRLALNYTV